MDTGEYNNRFYSEIFGRKAERYYRIQGKKMKTVTGMFEDHREGRILDIGCGDGLITSLLRDVTGAEAHGLDISRSAVAKANGKGIRAKALNVDEGSFPFRKNTFDAIFCGDLMEHVFDTEKLLDNMIRVLKPGGYAVISVPNIASWYNRGFLLMGLMPVWIESSLKTYTGNPLIKDGMGHIHAFTRRSLAELLRLKGFRIESVKGCPVLADGTRKRWKERIWNGVDSFFARKSTLASTLVIKARKPAGREAVS